MCVCSLHHVHLLDASQLLYPLSDTVNSCHPMLDVRVCFDLFPESLFHHQMWYWHYGALGCRTGHLGRVKTTMIVNFSSGASLSRCARPILLIDMTLYYTFFAALIYMVTIHYSKDWIVLFLSSDNLVIALVKHQCLMIYGNIHVTSLSNLFSALHMKLTILQKHFGSNLFISGVKTDDTCYNHFIKQCLTQAAISYIVFN